MYEPIRPGRKACIANICWAASRNRNGTRVYRGAAAKWLPLRIKNLLVAGGKRERGGGGGPEAWKVGKQGQFLPIKRVTDCR